MASTFVYSFYGDSYTGSFATRDEAMTAGIEAAQKLDEPPGTIFVGQLVGADTKAAGNARVVLASMRRRALEDLGETGDGYLKHITSEESRQLDETLERVILDWLQRHRLAERLLKVQGISEHPVPLAPQTPQPPEGGEVSEIGATDYPAENT